MDLVRHIRLELIPFLLQTEASNWMDLTFEEQEKDQTVITDPFDPWNHWVFEIDVSTEYKREESELNYDFEFEFDAWRVTDTWKIELELEYKMDRTEAKLTEGLRKVRRDSWDIETFVAYSLNSRVSLGHFAETGYARTRNLLFFAGSGHLQLGVVPCSVHQDRDIEMVFCPSTNSRGLGPSSNPIRAEPHTHYPKTTRPEMIDPLIVWTPAQAPAGLAVYRGDVFPEWKGNLFIGGVASGEIRRIITDNTDIVGEEKLTIAARVREIRQGPDGYLYVLTDEPQGRLIHIVRP